MQNERTKEILVEGLPYSDGRKVRIEKAAYGNGVIALRGILIGSGTGEEEFAGETSEEEFATFSVNVVEHAAKLKKNQTYMKTYSENVGMLEVLQKAKVVGPVLFEVQTGHVTVPAVEVLI